MVEAHDGVRGVISILAAKVFRRLCVAAAAILGVLRICTQGSASPGKCGPRRHDLLWRMALLHPVNNGGEHVETIQRRLPSCAVAHAWDQEEATPVADGAGSIVLGQSLVVPNSIQGREPGIAHAVIENQLAGVSGER